jgi:hypothetical protein
MGDYVGGVRFGGVVVASDLGVDRWDCPDFLGSELPDCLVLRGVDFE